MVPPYCSILSCGQQYHKGVRRSFFALPAVVIHKGKDILTLSQQRRYAWITAINQNTFYPLNKKPFVCSDHFHRGRPAELIDINDADWIPSLKMGGEENKPVKASTMEIPYSQHKDHDYCALPSRNSPSTLHHDNDIQFVDIESEQDDFTADADDANNDKDVLAVTPDFISPDFPLHSDSAPSCTNHECMTEKKRLRSQIHEKIAAHYVCQTELDAVRRELNSAKEQLASLRAQLEENTHALCAYLSAGGNDIIMKTNKNFT